ncbi:5'-methylthioadenosine/adenosylhomocysteine nucleosidase [Peptostreptococcus equinus]|uniref:adenosylhomocysteine nucleosidase n=1 Tax=Peptostreptococcus equinus TaxID=3003601 RepID=A0ABY7JLP9_9FIRM|nr:5'-methylthioadenosine/adenosylhomocysteine nucleosidase [Peptostreptococcus sp. CBA3647]WAW14247.1 5'-methylthioadenosine/adenosylhomocysteine nucleosidase [Peptostreptococcus sp. CBA3647]
MEKIGIIGAMEEEVEAIKAMIENKEVKHIAGLDFYEGHLKGKNIVVVKCGIAKVNAAMCTQILISEFKVDALINTGVAGALYEKLNINDVVISIDAMQHDIDASAAGDPKGTLPLMETSIFKADQRLVDIAYEVFESNDTPYHAYKGRIATGDIFVADPFLKDELRNHFGGYCCEMEGGAIGHVAYCNKVPFVVIRAISDKADGSAAKTFDEFVKIAADTSKDMVVGMLERL